MFKILYLVPVGILLPVDPHSTQQDGSHPCKGYGSPGTGGVGPTRGITVIAAPGAAAAAVMPRVACAAPRASHVEPSHGSRAVAQRGLRQAPQRGAGRSPRKVWVPDVFLGLLDAVFLFPEVGRRSLRARAPAQHSGTPSRAISTHRI